MTARVIVAVVAIACAWSACGGEGGDATPTQVIVSIHSDLAVGTELARIDVDVLDAAGMATGARASIPLGADALLPLSFTVSKRNSDAFRLQLRGFAAGATSAGVQHQVGARFQQDATVLLKVFLGRACLGDPCAGRPQQTCYPLAAGGIASGACGPVPMPALEPVIAGREAEAWGELMDAGADASLDGGDARVSDPPDSAAPFDGASEDGAASAVDAEAGQVPSADAGQDSGSPSLIREKLSSYVMDLNAARRAFCTCLGGPQADCERLAGGLLSEGREQCLYSAGLRRRSSPCSTATPPPSRPTSAV